MAEPWIDKGPLGLVLDYSEWLDSKGFVSSDKKGDHRSHAELVEKFMAERGAGK